MSANLEKLTVPELKKQLVASGLPVTGRKADLVQRLFEEEKKGNTSAYIEMLHII